MTAALLIDQDRLPDGWDEARVRRLAETIRTTHRTSNFSDEESMSESDALAEACRRIASDPEPGTPAGWDEERIDQLTRALYDARAQAQHPVNDEQWTRIQLTQRATVQMLRRDVIAQIESGQIKRPRGSRGRP